MDIVFFVEVTFLSIFGAFVFSLFTYRVRRDRIEQTCIEESRYKTFCDEFLSNLFIAIPLGWVIIIINLMSGAFYG